MVSRLTWTVSSTAGLAQVVVSLTVGSPSERSGVGAGPGPGASAVQATGGPGAPASPASSQGGLGTEGWRERFILMSLGHWDSLAGPVERVEGGVVHIAATGGVLVSITGLVTVSLLVLISWLRATVTIIPTTTR